MIRSLAAGAAYFLIVFAAGFLLGWIRGFYLAPRLGELGAVLLELPVMLLVSWIACGWALRRWRVPPDTFASIIIGAVALLLLLAAEAEVSMSLGGLSLVEHLRTYTKAPVLVGLGAQLLFAAFPLLRNGQAFRAAEVGPRCDRS